MGNSETPDGACSAVLSTAELERRLTDIFFRSITPDWSRRDDWTIAACKRMMRAAMDIEREALSAAITKKADEWDDRTEAYGMLLARDIVVAHSNSN